MIFKSFPSDDLIFLNQSRVCVIDGQNSRKKKDPESEFNLLNDLVQINGYSDPIHIKVSKSFDFKRRVLGVYIELKNMTKCFFKDLSLVINITDGFILDNDFEMIEKTIKIDQLSSDNTASFLINLGITNENFCSGKVKLR